MGYTTEFEGCVTFEPPLSEKASAWVNNLAERTHQEPMFPSTYCDWIIDNEGSLRWNGAEKFYGYVQWLEHVLLRLRGMGHIGTGTIMWQGEESSDSGTITVERSKVTRKPDRR